MAISILPIVTPSASDWSNPSNPQYHIQTDEGPERYFKYQTLNGQYRREKRLEDGTVIGTYAWIDDDGFLRQRDYIADNAGYRILKIKNFFVGRDMPIGQAMLAAKKATSSSSKSSARPAYLPPKTTAYVQYQTTPSPLPYVEISPNSAPSTTEFPPSVYGVPSTTVLPPVVSNSPPEIVISSTPPNTVYIPSTTPSPNVIYESSTKTFVTTTTKTLTETHQRITDNYLPKPLAISTLPPPIQSNSLNYYSGSPQYEHYTDDRPSNPYVFQNGPTYPIDKNGQTYNGRYRNKIDDTEYKPYDGVSVTNDGFRYYIPRAYHEEQSLPNEEKSGSFGYIDPFGIRRVIYYNASPDKGFQHRKNNRYVGFNATPYDPRPNER